MSSTSTSAVHSRARRSPVVSSSSPLPLRHILPSHHHPGSHSKRTRLRRGFVLCGLAFLVVELLLVRASLFYYKSGDDATSTSTAAIPPRRLPNGPPDGTFGGYPVYYRNVSAISTYTKPYTLLNCVGENYQATNWQYRSCHFTFLCFNLTSHQYQVYERKDDRDMRSLESWTPLMDRSESYLWNSSRVSLGGIHRDAANITKLQWFPQILSQPPTDFYALPPNVVVIPFSSMAGWNPGSLVWDDVLPMFTLMQIFLLSTDEYQVLAIRQSLGVANENEDDDKTLASCDAKMDDCQYMLHKFWGLVNNHTQPTTQRDVQLRTSTPPKTDLVCAKNGVAGMGALTDHGTQKLHGWYPEDYETTHNHGRGKLFWKFRIFCMEQLGIPTDSSALIQTPYRIVLSVQSSAGLDFNEQRIHLQETLHDLNVIVTTVVLKDMSLQEQLQLASQTSVFISGCGGGAVTATFLPKEATAILYYNETGGRPRTNIGTKFPARLDWDLFNHLSYLRVHWFPISTMHQTHDLNTLSSVVRVALHRQQLNS